MALQAIWPVHRVARVLHLAGPALLAGEAGPATASRAATAVVAMLTLAGMGWALAFGRRRA